MVWRLSDKGRSDHSKERTNKVERTVGVAKFTVRAGGKDQKPKA